MKKTLLTLTMAVAAVFGMNAQTHSDISGNTDDGAGTGYVYEYNGSNDNNCLALNDWFGNHAEMSWSFAGGIATLSHDGTYPAAGSPWIHGKFTTGDCARKTLDLGTSTTLKIRAKISDNTHALAISFNGVPDAALDVAAQKDVSFAANDTYEEITVTFGSSDAGNLTNFSAVEGLSFAVVKENGNTAAVTVDIDWIQIGSLVSGVELPEVANVTIAPNPASSVANVTYDGDAADIVVADITGNTVATAAGAQGAASVDVSGLAAGVYVVTISTGDALTTKRLVVE